MGFGMEIQRPRNPELYSASHFRAPQVTIARYRPRHIRASSRQKRARNSVGVRRARSANPYSRPPATMTAVKPSMVKMRAADCLQGCASVSQSSRAH